ncbi:pirin family protein [Anaeromyxobacter paludicola]|uniref:Quercetin 2,3-dioxygenase n=1 Tax=Anaeromyxobacter paludicola TaxID=2918171 RepID=A0ABM7XDA3_9BACT|nr:pirin family protein [Anaeromyxobacter paludicola]BDG09851.1 quercetin 2,3-dioxygenase [Anaeromyxobacter paludicola]
MQLAHVPAEKRYGFKEGWLETRWHFSFDHYYDPANVRFGALRVFNDDRIAPDSGFDRHPHREMEIVTVMLAGTLEHRDSSGGSARLVAGDVQRMSAGTGIAHSERNPSKSEATHLLQIWVLPDTPGLRPGYEQRRFERAARRGRLERVVTRDPGPGELKIHQDVDFYLGTLVPEVELEHRVRPGRRQYLFVIEGAVALDGTRLEEGDQGRITGAEALRLRALGKEAEVILIDLA